MSRTNKVKQEGFFSLSHLIREKGLLRDSRSVQVNEQLVMFLHTVGHNVKNRVIAHKFGHSGETVSRYFNIVLGAIIKLYPILLKPPSVAVHHRITNNEGRFYPYFKDCIGAIDGSHIPAWVHLSDHPRFRDRKGDISQNILAACDFDMKYTYILSGWEGSASDARILDNALHRDGDGKLVLPREDEEVEEASTSTLSTSHQVNNDVEDDSSDGEDHVLENGDWDLFREQIADHMWADWVAADLSNSD
ncbi:uncharacterized protein LOC122067929 [Macadamia integrifolia]|uniref:uncharacterized protein LOC122067929 n=1 Tax=Macadamia integrifolia TaxID=60698 RepID=UPI001C4F4807|nr:uncharacterized protein LOC122067929 [Macadamia integrifolia]